MGALRLAHASFLNPAVDGAEVSIPRLPRRRPCRRIYTVWGTAGGVRAVNFGRCGFERETNS